MNSVNFFCIEVFVEDLKSVALMQKSCCVKDVTFYHQVMELQFQQSVRPVWWDVQSHRTIQILSFRQQPYPAFSSSICLHHGTSTYPVWFPVFVWVQNTFLLFLQDLFVCLARDTGDVFSKMPRVPIHNKEVTSAEHRSAVKEYLSPSCFRRFSECCPNLRYKAGFTLVAH